MRAIIETAKALLGSLIYSVEVNPEKNETIIGLSDSNRTKQGKLRIMKNENGVDINANVSTSFKKKAPGRTVLIESIGDEYKVDSEIEKRILLNHDLIE